MTFLTCSSYLPQKLHFGVTTFSYAWHTTPPSRLQIMGVTVRLSAGWRPAGAQGYP